MKKLCIVALILVLAFPALAFADQDYIVGSWYVYSGIMEDDAEYLEIDTIHFTADGGIFSNRYTVSSTGVTTCKDYSVIGLWTKENDRYYINMGSGPDEIVLESNTMFFPASKDYKLRFIKMRPINYVIDLKQ